MMLKLGFLLKFTWQCLSLYTFGYVYTHSNSKTLPHNLITNCTINSVQTEQTVVFPVFDFLTCAVYTTDGVLHGSMNRKIRDSPTRDSWRTYGTNDLCGFTPLILKRQLSLLTSVSNAFNDFLLVSDQNFPFCLELIVSFYDTSWNNYTQL
jgi:hypothetical protein